MTLKDNSVICGYYGFNSFAGDERRDLFLESVYEQTEKGWEEVGSTEGVFIAENQISAIEFFKVEGEEYG